MIDLLDAGALQRLDDAAEIAVAGVAGVDQQRLARRPDEERRLATLGVDVIDVQRSRCRLRPDRPMVPTARHNTNTIAARIISDSLGADYTPLQDKAHPDSLRDYE